MPFAETEGWQRAVRSELEGLGLYKLLTQRAQLGVVFQRYRDGFGYFQRGRTGEALRSREYRYTGREQKRRGAAARLDFGTEVPHRKFAGRHRSRCSFIHLAPLPWLLRRLYALKRRMEDFTLSVMSSKIR